MCSLHDRRACWKGLFDFTVSFICSNTLFTVQYIILTRDKQSQFETTVQTTKHDEISGPLSSALSPRRSTNANRKSMLAMLPHSQSVPQMDEERGGGGGTGGGGGMRRKTDRLSPLQIKAAFDAMEREQRQKRQETSTVSASTNSTDKEKERPQTARGRSESVQCAEIIDAAPKKNITSAYRTLSEDRDRQSHSFPGLSSVLSDMASEDSATLLDSSESPPHNMLGV